MIISFVISIDVYLSFLCVLPVNVNRSMQNSSQAKTKVLCLGQPDPPNETPPILGFLEDFCKKNQNGAYFGTKMEGKIK